MQVSKKVLTGVSLHNEGEHIVTISGQTQIQNKLYQQCKSNRV